MAPDRGPYSFAVRTILYARPDTQYDTPDATAGKRCKNRKPESCKTAVEPESCKAKTFGKAAGERKTERLHRAGKPAGNAPLRAETSP